MVTSIFDKIDFIQLSNIIFKNKNKYKLLDDSDKIRNFFIINRKIGHQYIKIAQTFNSKYIDLASVIDIWFVFFRKNNDIPRWWFDKSQKIKTSKTFQNSDKKLIMDRNEHLNDNDYNFLEKYYKDDLTKEIKKIKKYNN